MARQDYEIAEYSREKEDERLVNSFADFLVLKEISGTKRIPTKSAVISSQFVNNTNNKVEVVKDDTLPNESNHNPVTVLMHRNETGEVEQIEVICSCGRKSLVALEYEDEQQEVE